MEYLNPLKLEQFSLCHSFLHSTLLKLLFQNQVFFCIPASAAEAAEVNPNGIKTLLANGFITFFINGNQVFNNGPRSWPRNPPD